MRKLNAEGNIVYAGSNVLQLKTNLVGSFGDVPSVFEIKHLSGYDSYWLCRFCTIRPCKVGCFRQVANDQNDSCCGRTLEYFLFGDIVHGVKDPSIFRKLPSFSSPTFIGIDIFYLFGLNIAWQLKSFLRGKGCSLYSKRTHSQSVDTMIELQASSVPDAFNDEFKNVFLASQRLIGVDWSIFIQLILLTLPVK